MLQDRRAKFRTLEEFFQEFYEALKRHNRLYKNPFGPFSTLEHFHLDREKIAKDLGITVQALSRRVKQSIKAGYLVKLERGRYAITEKGLVVANMNKKPLVEILGTDLPNIYVGLVISDLVIDGEIAEDSRTPISAKSLVLRNDKNEAICTISLDESFRTGSMPRKGSHISLRFHKKVIGETPQEAVRKAHKLILKALHEVWKEFGITINPYTWTIRSWRWTRLLRPPAKYQATVHEALSKLGVQVKIGQNPNNPQLLEVEFEPTEWSHILVITPYLNLLVGMA